MADAKLTNGRELELEISKCLDDMKGITIDALQRAVDRTAKETVSEIKSKAPVKTGIYKKSWTSRVEFNSGGVYARKVYNSKRPQLTYLLQNGHAIRGPARFSKNKTRTRAFPHIPTDADTEKRFEKTLTEEIERGLNNDA